MLVIAFGLFLYAELRARIHPLLAGILITMLACSPELFAYTFLVQTDWANAAFFATGVILLQRYLESGQHGSFVGSAVLLAMACWTRTETIFFVPIGSLLLLIFSVSISKNKALFRAIALSAICLLPVVFWNYILLRGYIPLPPRANLGTLHGVTEGYLSQLIAIAAQMNDQVIFDDVYWGYAVWVFLLLSLVNTVIFRDKRGFPILLWLAGIYILFVLIIQHVEGANVLFTFRRGFFKLLFLMYFYLGTTSLFRWLSNWIYRWESKIEKPET
ncbi:glycosyltransferase family 39 protein [Spirosoma telluris]|uniref:glycosyltransferase family 39 protein n=1 Tax=Spirosoma telluris TaxID=2183553 RepID=UPI0012FB6980